MLPVTPFYVDGVSNPSTGFRIRIGVFESRGTVLYGVWVFYLPEITGLTFVQWISGAQLHLVINTHPKVELSLTSIFYALNKTNVLC